MELKKEKDNYKNEKMEIEKMIKEMEIEKLNIIMEIYMMINGKIIKRKVLKMKKSLFKTLINLKKKNILVYIRIKI